MRNGGRRPGAGRPKGSKSIKTLEEEAARECVRQEVTKHLESLLAAQLDNALGIRHLIVHDPKTGKYERVTGSPDEIDEALAGGAFYIYTKDPNVQAFTDLMNRAIDKPSEHVQVAGADGGPIVIGWQRLDELPLELDSNAIEIEAHEPETDSQA